MYENQGTAGPYTSDGGLTLQLRASNRPVMTLDGVAYSPFKTYSITIPTENGCVINSPLKVTSSSTVTLQGTACMRIV